MLLPARMIGVATAIYSAALIVRPSVLTKPTGLSTSNDDVTTAARVLTRGIAARDLVSGLAMAAAPTAAGVRLAAAVRIGADAADATGFGLALPDPAARRKSALVAAGWGLLTVLALAAARDD
ncbi:MAG: hypothetical protein M3501_02570 [Actinomycetota bacterium]|nr:hypothetical protein [Actinomycetota bacterium]MDQ3350835.1 hypothetical protein [Actinomycetota bacterium]